MILIIGGYAQGKLNYAKEYVTHMEDACIKEMNGAYPSYQVLEAKEIFSESLSPLDGKQYLIINNINEWVNDELKSQSSPEDLRKTFSSFVNSYPNSVIISQEIGCGIVPMEMDIRYYREEMGRLQIYIAGLADHVIRVHCGIGLSIK